MNTYIDCYPCLLRQAITATRMAKANQEQQKLVMDQVLADLTTFDLLNSPPVIAWQIHHTVRQILGNGDPYQDIKKENTREALELLPRVRQLIDEASDPRDMALRMSIAGNIIDFGPEPTYDLWQVIDRIKSQSFALDDRELFWKAYSQADWILYLADNAGETVFDKLFIGTLDKKVTYAVKGSAVLNDATEQDAVEAGIDEIATIVNTGSNAPGTLIDACSNSFLEIFNAAPLVIAKGQANYETLSTAGEKVFHFLQIKCPVIGSDIGAPAGSIVVKQASSGQFERR